MSEITNDESMQLIPGEIAPIAIFEPAKMRPEIIVAEMRFCDGHVLTLQPGDMVSISVFSVQSFSN